MRRQIKLVIYLFTIVNLFCHFSLKIALAAELPKFDLKTETIYQYVDAGKTKVTINYSLTNLSSAFFASQYAVQINSGTDIRNLKAFDSGGALTIESKVDGNKPKEIVTFKSPVAGIGKVQKWTVSYESSNLIKKNSSLIQVMLPPPAVDEFTTDYSVVLKIPETIARPVSVNPPAGKTQAGQLTWTKSDLKNSGIYSVFSTQKKVTPFISYDFKINYNVTNPKLVPVNVEVPLPPDTSYQKIFLQELNPRPLDVRVDNDGNWLAKYYLGSNAKVEITAKGQVALFQKPTVTTFTPKPDLKKLVRPDQFWEVDNTGIMAEAKKYESVRAIYEGVLANLKNRDIEKSPDARRAGAQYTLLVGKSASGQDYTDLFIALSRAQNVPAREVIGIIPSSSLTSSLQLQSWAEYYQSESNSWRMVDPSLEAATKGLNYFSDWDLNHFALIIRGESSVKPFFPNFSPKDSFNVSVTPSESDLDIFSQPKVNLHPDIPRSATAGFPIAGKLFVENAGPTAHNSEIIQLTSSDFSILTPTFKTEILPPFASRILDIKIQSSNWLSSTNGKITLEASGTARDFTITVNPIYRSGFVQILALLIILGTISIAVQVSRAIAKKSS